MWCLMVWRVVSLGVVVVMTLRGGEEGEMVATVVDTGDKDDRLIPQQTNTSMGTCTKHHHSLNTLYSPVETHARNNPDTLTCYETRNRLKHEIRLQS